jgi:hypothetical protein
MNSFLLPRSERMPMATAILIADMDTDVCCKACGCVLLKRGRTELEPEFERYLTKDGLGCDCPL